jgi:hypothetical protein
MIIVSKILLLRHRPTPSKEAPGGRVSSFPKAMPLYCSGKRLTIVMMFVGCVVLVDADIYFYSYVADATVN